MDLAWGRMEVITGEVLRWEETQQDEGPISEWRRWKAVDR